MFFIWFLMAIGCYLFYKWISDPKRNPGPPPDNGGPPGGTKDKPDLPPLPPGIGPIPNYVPEEWVMEYHKYRIAKKVTLETGGKAL